MAKQGVVASVLSFFGGPTKAFLTLVAALFGILFAVGIFTFGYAGGLNYFGHDPKACNQCHSMREHYEGWQKGSHHNVATCQDCHAPHGDFVAWAINEADNGFWHSLKFTTGQYPENIKIRDHNREITEAACLHCHENMVGTIEGTRRDEDQKISCVQCHSQVGHKR